MGKLLGQREAYSRTSPWFYFTLHMFYASKIVMTAFIQIHRGKPADFQFLKIATHGLLFTSNFSERRWIYCWWCSWNAMEFNMSLKFRIKSRFFFIFYYYFKTPTMIAISVYNIRSHFGNNKQKEKKNYEQLQIIMMMLLYTREFWEHWLYAL